AVCLLDPLWSGQRARPGANLFVVMADNSQGMQIKDRDETRSRGELLRDLVSMGKSDWLAKLDANFQLRRYLFDARLQSTRDFSELALDGRASAIGAAIRTIAGRYREQLLAGPQLLTDSTAMNMRHQRTNAHSIR